MEMTAEKHIFDSSNLHYGLYLPDKNVLYIGFRGDDTRIYRYSEVPSSIWESLIEAESSGRFFNSIIRPRYPTEEITNIN